MGSSDHTRGFWADHPALLFGLAPGGVCQASTITDGPVSSYLAFSTLPREIKFLSLTLWEADLNLQVGIYELVGTLFHGAVCFLWYFPSITRGRC